MISAQQVDAATAVTQADAHPFVGRVKEFSSQVLRPTALRTDAAGVDRARIGELRDVGLLNYLQPHADAGTPIDRNADRRIHEHLSASCFNTWLVWAQHAPMVGWLIQLAAEGKPISALAAQALRGEILLGAAVSDVRRFPDHYIRAERTAGGWVFDGTISWVSGWGLNLAIAVAAVDPSSRTVVTALLPVTERFTGTPLHLAAVGGSHTERVAVDHVFVPDEQVISTQTLQAWHHTDYGTASDARAHHFGLAYAVLEELDASPHPLAVEIADLWRPRVEQIRADAYGLNDEAAQQGGGSFLLAERLATKAASGEALATLTRALVIARSGRGLAGDSTSQLHARSALFVLIQGQTGDVRQAQLEHILNATHDKETSR